MLVLVLVLVLVLGAWCLVLARSGMMAAPSRMAAGNGRTGLGWGKRPAECGCSPAINWNLAVRQPVPPVPSRSA
jgi:hypothetical protein